MRAGEPRLVVGTARYGRAMTRQNWIVGAALAVLVAALVLVIGGPGWAVGLGLLAGFLVVLLTVGLRD